MFEDPAGPQIYTTSPSGIYRAFKAYALGSGEATARNYLKENYAEDLTFDETVKLTLTALKESINEKPTKDNTRFAYIKSEDNKFHMCSKDEVGKFLSLIKEEPEPKV
ncbi:MAG: hypothetical protein HWN79_16495 [Candidatus Lokiarchaeota archaeon]|nr:hypothetical protein [Candidatus Lokiarchaeota archaeon]